MVKKPHASDVLADNLQRLMREKGWNALSLSRAAGQTDTAVRDLIKKRSKSPGMGRLSAIAAVLKVTVEALYQPAGGVEAATSAQAVAIQAEQRKGSLILTIPADSPIADHAIKLLQLFAAADQAQRDGILLRLQNPGLSDQPPRTAAVGPDLDVEAVMRRAVDAAIARGELVLTASERRHLIANLTDDAEAVIGAEAQRDHAAAALGDAGPGGRKRQRA